MLSPSDGVLELLNNAGTSFNRIQFGGTTTSFAAIKLSGTGLAVRLADDSADTSLSASSLTLSGNTVNTAGFTNYLGVTTNSGPTYTATPTTALTAVTTGASYYIKINAANTTTNPTINISALGAKTVVKRAAAALAANDMLANGFYQFVYDGTNLQIMNPTVP
jgi:hypothetical protein